MDAGVFSFPCFLLVFQEDLVPLVNQLLFTLDVFEHVVGFWNSHVIGKYFRILLVKFENARESLICLLQSVETLEVFREIVKNEILFEH